MVKRFINLDFKILYAEISRIPFILFLSIYISISISISIFLGREGKWRKKERERNTNVRKKHQFGTLIRN